MRHLVDLENGIREIEQKIRHLQTENTELIRELCDVRAQNREWKERETTATAGARTQRRRGSNNANRKQPPQKPEKRQTTNTTVEEEEPLYEPFAAMWNLIQLDPAVIKGNVTAATMLERLKGMVEVEMAAERRRLSLESIDEDEEDSDGNT